MRAVGDTRFVYVGSQPYSIGWFAGTDLPHPMIPDGYTGSSCTLCFGWCCDSRHLGRDILPPPVILGVKRQIGRRIMYTAGHDQHADDPVTGSTKCQTCGEGSWRGFACLYCGTRTAS